MRSAGTLELVVWFQKETKLVTGHLYTLAVTVGHLGTRNAIRPIVRAFVYIAWSIAGFVAPITLDKLKRWNPRLREVSFRAFHARERFRSRLLPERKLRILFSPERSLEQNIKDGFSNTPHEIAFEDFPPRNAKSYDLIVPLTLPDLKYLSKMRDLIIDSPIPIPSLDCILLCDDKYLLNKALAANGFGRFIPKMGGALAYPYILKKRIDVWGRNSHLIADKQQEQVFSDISANPDYFSQTYIKGSNEYATHILFKNQRIVHSLNIEYMFNTETPIKGKDSQCKMTCPCPYLDLFTAMLTSIGFNGLCCINYKVCDNHPFLLEINPRFGASLSPYFYSFIRRAA